MLNFTVKLAFIFMYASFFPFQAIAQTTHTSEEAWAFDSIHIPQTKTISKNKPIIIAVVDDAFKFSHNELKGFLYKNTAEISNNQLDDDGNNYVDDVSGWDISDHDNNVNVVEGREKVFYHGTYVSSIIAKIAKLHYGVDAPNRIKIMPVKVISDQANKTYIKDGYKGIKYAIENGADIICLAWSGGHPGSKELKILEQAHQKGILIIASAGNLNDEKFLYPALVPSVIAVAGTNIKQQKMKLSNYGIQVDISAPAKYILGAHPIKNNAYIHDDGTSASTALVAGCAAVIMSKKEDLTDIDVKEILLNTATPFNKNFMTYGGKMGAGIVNLKNAIDYISEDSDKSKYFSSLRPKGSIVINKLNSINNWKIAPAGNYHGFFLEANIVGIKKPWKHSFQIIVEDSIWAEYNLANIPSKIFVPSPSIEIEASNNTFKKNDILKIDYYGKIIDSTTLYCSGMRYVGDEKGSITDGSGENNYANYSSCKWLITVADGKRIKFTFDQMDTQANIDYVYIVDGRSVIRENYIALFSGQNKPPIITSRTNEVLIWFVSDKTTTGKGWSFHYEAIE